MRRGAPADARWGVSVRRDGAAALGVSAWLGVRRDGVAALGVSALGVRPDGLAAWGVGAW
jgi:hypothetical protein